MRPVPPLEALSRQGGFEKGPVSSCFLDHSPPSNYWHTFPRGVVPMPIGAASVLAHATPASSSTPTSSSTPASLSTIPTGPHCAYAKCHTTRINKYCSRRMCKRHCDSSGHCTVHPIQSPSSSPSFTAPIPLTPLAKLTEQARAYSNHIPRAAIQLTRHQHQIEEDHVLALATPLPPSPTLSEETAYHELMCPLSPVNSTSPVSMIELQTSKTITLVYWLENGPAHIQAIQDPPRLVQNVASHPAQRPSWPA
ncbi:hypothetical protein B0H16DRAFT_1460490 [Mycena metata]|uniref:Uncharacterized protein n=1 Tax=Mycena metata TaxID=1033252 RepID=A0AAD7IUI1_9AGAR|nr:hypothetical protein B0H16DRAFT_1460490 [Mycena metata]